MAGKRVLMVGRKADLAAVEECVGTVALVLVRGEAGMGKTTLLSEIRRIWRARGKRVVQLEFSGRIPRWDEFGALAAVECVQDNFHEIGDFSLVPALTALSRSITAGAYSSADARRALFAKLVQLFRFLRRNGPVLVLIDDLHTAPNPALAVAAACQAGCTVLASGGENGFTTAPTALGALAGQVIELAPMRASEIDELLDAIAPVRIDGSVGSTVRAALGPLAGNPGAVLSTFEKLRRDGRFVEVGGWWCLNGPDVPVALPADHFLMRQVARFGEPGRELIALIDAVDRFRVDDLLTFAAATGRDLLSCGRVADGLAAAGVLDCDDGILSTSCPALTTAVVSELGPDRMATVHRTLAEYLLRENRRLPEPAVVADHITLAGTAIPPDPALVALLNTAATRATRTNPGRAARWYHAALWHCPRGGPDHSRILGTVLRLLVRTGRYGCLREVVTDAVAAGFEESLRYELAVSAALAAVHTGVPVPGAVYAALATDAAGCAPLEFAAAWFAGRGPFGGEELEAVFGAFRTDRGSVGFERSEASEVVAELNDTVAMFGLVLGSEYGEPEQGPLAISTRVVRNYAECDWHGITSDARRLELARIGEGTAAHQFARLLSAEVCSVRGEAEEAGWWLERVDDDCPFPAMRTWVEMGIALRAGNWEQAEEYGWAGYEKLTAKADQGAVVGFRRFLVRLGYAEMRLGLGEKLQTLRAEAKRWRARRGGRGPRIAELVLTGIAEHDQAAAIEAVGLLRECRMSSDLMYALLVVATLSEEPHRWYQEAYEIARGLGEEAMRAIIKADMRDSGVAAPPHRTDREKLSDLEKRIIGLIQQGLTNRQIAAAARVSEKTVDSNLKRLFAKTGYRSRLELATASLEGRLAAVLE